MFKRLFVYAIGAVYFLPACLLAAEEGHVSQSDLTEQAMRDQVKVLREQRYNEMPYLDRRYIRSTIRPEKVKQKILFVSRDKKKLEELVDRALAVHTAARAARERVSLAQRRILTALRALFPEAKFDLNQREGSLSGQAFNSRNYRFTFRQPVFRGGILWNTFLQEKAGLEAAQKEYEAVIGDLVNDVSAAYFQYQRAQQVVTGQGKEIEKMQRFVEISQQKFKEQIISEIEHLNTQSLYGQMQYDHETSKQELELAKLDLQRFLDLKPEDPISVIQLYRVEDLLSAEKPEGKYSKLPEGGSGSFEGSVRIPSLGELVDLAYEHRPQLRVEAAKLESARLEQKVKWGELMPHADVVVEFGKLAEALDAQATFPSLRPEFRLLVEVNWNAGGNKIGYTLENDERAPSVTQFLQTTGTTVHRHSLSAGLFDGLKELAEAKEAEIAKLDQVVELEKVEKEVIHEVKQAYYDYQKARIQVNASLQRLDYRQRLVELAEHRLGNNEIQISEYLQADIDYLHELSELHKAFGDYFTAKAKLNHAIGIRGYLPIEEWHGS